MARIDPAALSNVELQTHAEYLRRRLGAAGARIQALGTSRARTTKILRATFLTAGGFFAVTVDVLGGLLLLVGAWDWVDAIRDDVETMNAQNSLQLELSEIEEELEIAETELENRLGR